MIVNECLSVHQSSVHMAANTFLLCLLVSFLVLGGTVLLNRTQGNGVDSLISLFATVVTIMVIMIQFVIVYFQFHRYIQSLSASYGFGF